MTDKTTPGFVVKSYWKAEECRDIDAVLGFYHSGAELVVPGMGRLAGHDEIGTFYAASISRFPRLQVTVESELELADRGAFEWSAVFTDHAGKTWHSAGVNIICVRAGKFASVHVYYDPAQLAGK